MADIYTEPLENANSIRLLYLLKRRRRSTKPRALLKAVSLDNLGNVNRYLAVSYAWGRLTNLLSMTINDRTVQVGENIWHFLDNAQWHNKHKTPLWIDAICINQADVEEKNRQVQMMSKIYECADQVIIWLGPHADESKTLFDFWAHARFNVPTIKHRFTSAALKFGPSSHDSYGPYHHTYKGKRLERLPMQVTEALALLCKRNYWKRTWVLQECLLADRENIIICCGEHRTDWEILKESVKLEYLSPSQTTISHPMYVKNVFEEWMKLDELLTHGGHGRGMVPGRIIIGWKDWYPELFTLFEYIRSTECSDMHDKVFGILSIVQHNPNHNPINVDYSITIEKLFLRTLACWSAGYVTVRIANYLMEILRLDVASMTVEVQREEYLNFHTTEHGSTAPIPIEFLAIRLGTVSEITMAPLSFIPASKLSKGRITFDGLYSNRLNILNPEWSKERPDCAVGVSSCAIAAGDIVYAFMDSMAAVIFREQEDRLISVGAAILADAGEIRTSEDEQQIYHIAENPVHSKFLVAGTLPSIEVDLKAVCEIDIDAEPRFAISIWACHSGKYDWPPLRSKISQRHLHQFI